MKKSKIFNLVMLSVAFLVAGTMSALACTGISLQSADGGTIIARSMEWGTFDLESNYCITPRGYQQIGLAPNGEEGLKFSAKWGYVGLTGLGENYVFEGVNEKGLVGETFYFPNYGEYETYQNKFRKKTICDVQFLNWVLSQFATIDEMAKGLEDIHITAYGQGFGTAHWRVADASGRQVVIEILEGKIKIWEDLVGVITNAPEFDWHMTNLNNYVNMMAGVAPAQKIVNGIEIKSFGIGSASLGLPGDLTPPSRFVRAVFYMSTAKPQASSKMAVMQAFQILNNFDIPIGTEFSLEEADKIPENMLSATQWTTATDLKEMKFYYKTSWNSTLRCIDLNTIDFSKISYQEAPMDEVKEQRVEMIQPKEACEGFE